jgi:hypothetical protein
MAHIFLANRNALLPRRLLALVQWLASPRLWLARAATGERAGRGYGIGVQFVCISQRNAYGKLYNYNSIFFTISYGYYLGGKSMRQSLI